MIRFQCQDELVCLDPGEHFAKPRAAGFRDTSSEELRSLITEMESGRHWREVVAERYATSKPWLYRIITDESRTRFFDTVIPRSTGLALDIGSGWGQTARPLAASRPVVALEPVAERLAFIQAAARQDNIHAQIAYIEADYLETEFTTQFDLICTIGVLEWVGAFQDQFDPRQRQQDFLTKTHRELSSTGSLVIGIENRLGLKYLLGCPDDHIGVPHIASMPAPVAIERWAAASGQPLRSFTYSPAELQTLLFEAGYQQVDFFAAFPDYKLPAVILPLETVNDWLKTHTPPSEHNGYDGMPLDDNLQAALITHYRALAVQGVAHQYAPSFFVRAS